MAIEFVTDSNLLEYENLARNLYVIFHDSARMQLLLKRVKSMELQEKYLQNVLGENR